MPETLKSFLSIIADLTSSAYLTGVTFFCVLYLLITKNGRVAFILLNAFVLSMVITGLSKLYLEPCSHIFIKSGVEKLCYHTSVGIAVYGTFAAIIAQQVSTTMRRIILGAMFLLVILIALWSVTVQHNKPQEVLLSLPIGGGVALLSVLLMRFVKTTAFRLLPLLLTYSLASFLFYRSPIPDSYFIRKIAAHLGDHISFCEWKSPSPPPATNKTRA